MYSGGLDSVGCLHALLTEDAYAGFQVHVHHMHLLNRENRAKAEQLATRATIEEFKKLGVRPFLHSESGHDYRFLKKRFIWDMDMSAFMAANIAAADASVVHVAMGRTRTDVESGSERFAHRMERAQKVFDAIWSLEERPRPDYIFPVLPYTKTEIWLRLPERVRERAWSCRRPRYEGKRVIACGTCNTCKDMEALRKEVAAMDM